MASNHKLPWVAVAVTTFMLLIVAAFGLLAAMLVLNGVSERKGTIAMGLWLACHLIVIVLMGGISSATFRRMRIQLQWSPAVSLILATIASTFIGTAISFFSFLVILLSLGIR